jgi:mono/diheme cytochrome c family protein
MGHGRRAERRGHGEHRRVLRQQGTGDRRSPNKDTVALGEKIYRGGIADRAMPACAGCHSPAAPACPAQYPRLGGQHADYTEAQLLAFRSARAATTPR